MSYTIRVKGYAYEQKLVGFKDADSFNEKVDENDDNLFYELLDDEPDYCKELAHQYVLSGEGEDMLSIIDTFSNRLDGLRKHKKEIKEFING